MIKKMIPFFLNIRVRNVLLKVFVLIYFLISIFNFFIYLFIYLLAKSKKFVLDKNTW